jgi:hypothetical protein
LVLVMNAALLSLIPGAHTQSTTAFNVDDLLDVKNVSLADLSDDSRWMAVTIGSARDRIGVDNHRFGDPTYTAPSLVEVWVIETQTAKSQKLFSDKRQVRAMRWSPDGSRLALLEQKPDGAAPMIWERASGQLQPVSLPAGEQGIVPRQGRVAAHDGNPIARGPRRDDRSDSRAHRPNPPQLLRSGPCRPRRSRKSAIIISASRLGTTSI